LDQAEVKSGDRRFLVTYVVAVVVLGVVAIGWLLGSRWLSSQGFDYGAPRPTQATVAGYLLAYRHGASSWSSLRISADGHECDVLADSQFLRDACVLTVNVDPSWIAAPAAGRINNEDTPSYLGVTWRAVMAADPAFCDRGGLLGDRSTRCKSAAASGSVTFSDGDWMVTVSSSQR